MCRNSGRGHESWPSHTLLFFSFRVRIARCSSAASKLRPSHCAVTLRLFVCELAPTHTVDA
eukprot:scaffold7312_cov64-Phaeocystis_antarctica.AAC.3